jgi:radical SAM superfamily enzyme YgiQ (UPF0313 family)
MRIVLVTLHVRPSAQAVPLAAGCLAAALPARLRRKARLLDLFPGTAAEQNLGRILGSDPELVAFPLYVWNREEILALTRRLRAARPNLFLLAGGPEATADPEGVLQEGFLNAVIRGEGEEVFRVLVEGLARGAAPSPLPGLTLQTPEGIVAGPEPAGAANLEDLPSPWLTEVLKPQAGGGVLWEITRGCPFRCDFCYEGRDTRAIRHVLPARLEAELDIFVQAKVSQVWVLDSTFNFPPGRGKNLLRLLARKAPNVHFHLEAKADCLDRETVRLLGRLPCSVQFGLQSARPEVLKNIHRSLDPDLFARRMHLLSGEEGVTFGLDLIYGLPEDDYRGFLHSFNFALGFSPNHIDLFPLAVLPGTALHRRAHEFGIRSQNRPPYEILESASWKPVDLERSRLFSAGADLFYNVGRAVGFFPSLLRATGRDAASFLSGFTNWALARPDVSKARLLDIGRWKPGEVLPLQEEYVGHLLREAGRESLLPAALDLIRYHFHYAETLLGEEILPALPTSLEGFDPWQIPWRTVSTLRMVTFAYEILDLLEMGEADLEEFSTLFRPVGSTAIFLRRGNQVWCESLEEDFLKLLRGCDGRRTPEEIFAGSIPRALGGEIVEFAASEGLLLPAHPPKGRKRK